MNKQQRETLERFAAVALNFVRVDTAESCTRLCAVMCCATGCFVGLAAAGFAFVHREATAAIVALTGIEGGLIASGCVALCKRTQPASSSGDSKP